jgi:hypothetical protein
MPPPGRRFEDKKKYDRKRAREELKRALQEGFKKKQKQNLTLRNSAS